MSPSSVTVRLMGRLLPASFRERQREEWTGDLLALDTPADRRRYLVGAARTLPSLRRAAHRRVAPDVIALPAGILDTVARVLLSGLLFTMTAFYLFVPLRYYAFDIPGRIAGSNYSIAIDPKDVWPLGGDETGLLFPLWFVLHLNGWAVLLGSGYLITSVLLAGLVATAIGRRRNAAGLGVALLLGIAVAAVSTTMLFLVGHTEDYGWTAALLGLAAIVLALFRPSLPRRTRVLLAVVGLSNLLLPIWFNTVAGVALRAWFFD